MITPERIHKPRFNIERVVHSLERYGQYDFRTEGFIRIERWPVRRAIEAYRSTLNAMHGKLEGESPSSTMVTKATVAWNVEKAEIGFKVRQRHIGYVRPEVAPQVDRWIRAGKPYPSSGGFYWTVPNKSWSRVNDLTKVPELRDAVRNLKIEDEWLLFWEKYLPLRYEMSRSLLEAVKMGVDKEALSRHNEEAGTGLLIRGRRLKRKDLADAARDLDFLLDYGYSLGVAFAATQLAELPGDAVWVIDVYDPRIKGAIASRSDVEVLDVAWNGDILAIDAIAQTRQAGSDASGVLTNSYSERRLLRNSVTEQVLREYRRPGIEYPFTNRDTLIDAWSLDAKPFKGKRYIIGQDFGLSEPVKSPADALFSRGFIRLSGKTLPLMLSGSSWTQAVYSAFHNAFIKRAAPGDILLALGDDMNLLTSSSTEEIFAPYIKVKSTDPVNNRKKVLGLFTAFSAEEDLHGEKDALIGIVPRVIKTISSASKRGSHWGETLSDLAPSGMMELEHLPETEELVHQDLPIILPYMQWNGKRRDLLPRLQSLWGHMSPEVFAILARHQEEIQHRFSPEALEPVEDETTPS